MKPVNTGRLTVCRSTCISLIEVMVWFVLTKDKADDVVYNAFVFFILLFGEILWFHIKGNGYQLRGRQFSQNVFFSVLSAGIPLN